jgi:hypothetical protein
MLYQSLIFRYSDSQLLCAEQDGNDIICGRPAAEAPAVGGGQTAWCTGHDTTKNPWDHNGIRGKRSRHLWANAYD